MNENEASVDVVANNATQFLNVMDQVSKAYDKLVVDVNEAATKVAAAGSKFEKAGDDMGGTATDVKKVGDASIDASREVDKAAGDIDTDLGKVATSAKQAGQDSATGIKKIPDAAEDAAQKTNRSGDIIKGVFVGIGMAALDMAAQAGQAMVGFAVDGIKLAGDFEAGMNQFKVAAGTSIDAKGIEDFRDVFLDIGKRLPVSTMEVQEAATTLVKGGIDPLVLKMGGLEKSIKFAAASNMDLDAAAELSIKTLGTFVSATATAEEQTAFLASAQDKLVKVAGASTLDVDTLGKAMLLAGGQAKAAGVDYDDFANVMGLISPSFASAEQAGTSYKNFLVRLIPSTDPAKAAMADLGLMTFDTAAAISQLNAAGIDPEGMGIMDMKNALFDLATANGASEKEANKWLDAFDKSAFYDLEGNFVGNAKAAQLLQDATKNLSDEEKVHALQTIFGNDAMGAAVALADQGKAGYDKFAASVANASGVQDTAQGVQQGFNIALDNMKGSVEALQIQIFTYLLPVLTDLFNNVISPAIGTIMELVDAFFEADGATVNLARAFGDLFGLGLETQELFGYIGEIITKAMNQIMAIVGLVLEEIQEFWAANGEEILQNVNDLWEGVLDVIGPALQLIDLIITTVFKAIAKFIIDHGDQIKTIIKTVWTIIYTIVDTALKLIGGIIRTVLALLKGDWAGAWNAIKETVFGVWENIKTLISAALKLIVESVKLYLQTMAGQALTEMARVKDNIVGGITNALDGIKAKFAEFANAGQQLAKKLDEGVLAFIGNIKTSIVDGISNAINFGADLIEKVKAFGGDVVSKIVAGIVGAAGTITTALYNAVVGALSSAWETLTGWLANPLGKPPGTKFLPDVATASVPPARQPYTYNPFASGAGNVSTTYQLNVSTRQTDAGVIHQFNVMRALAK